MKTRLILLILTFLLIVDIKSGRILSGDLSVDYANAGFMTRLSFSFMLQNSIDKNDYIKISLPFPLHSQLVPAYPADQGLSLPSGLVLTYQLMDNSGNILPTVYYGQILTQTIDSSNYFIRFYNTDRKTFIPIVSSQWYFITFTIQQTDPLQYQKSNSILQIQISTVSSVWPNAMVYDDNLAFNYFSLSSQASKSITLIASPFNFGTAGSYLLTQNTYSMNLDVTLNISGYFYNQNIVLKFLISQKNTFKWTGSCLSVSKLNAPIINQLNSSLFTCNIDTVQNVINVILKPQALALQQSFRFTAGIINPPIVIKNSSIIVRAVKQQSGVIIGYGQHDNSLNTNQIYVTYQEIFVGWGLRPDALLPFDARIFRGNAADPTYLPYNSLTLKFQVSQSTSSTTQLKIIIDIPSQSNAFVLQNAYITNLPSASNKIVKCVTQYASVGASRRIGCTGVGALSSSVVYEIGWKMFFPYDNYQSSIDCTQFGTLTIYTTQKISSTDNVFFLGRGNQFLSYLKSSPQFYLIGRNSSYITYMRTFLNLNLVVSSQDFQQFLKYPEDIFVTNRPDTYTNKLFNDVYVIRQNLAFMTYLSLFDDVYIAAKLKSDTDIIKGYDQYPLLAKSTPKNTLKIITSNSKDWTDNVTDLNPLVSSTTATSGITSGNGLKSITGTSQSLIFGLKAPYADVTKTSSISGTAVPYNWGMLIMMSPKIKFNSSNTLIVSQSDPGIVSKSAYTIDDASAYNKYTLITLKCNYSNQIIKSFPQTGGKKYIGLYPFTIEQFGSIYSNEDNMDIMIAMVDGIDGPLNKMKFNSFFLINSFSMVNTVINTINYGFMNYEPTNPMDGSKVPTVLRIKGSIADSVNFESVSIFFDRLTPFYSNYYTGDIFCRTTASINSYCKYYKGNITDPKIHNYQTLSRIDIPISTPSTAFNIFIPVTILAGHITNLYIGYQKKDPITNKRSLVYIQPLRSIPITQPSSQTGVYGPGVASAFVGQNITAMSLKANCPGTIAVNSGNNIGGAFSYFSEWDYIRGSTVTGWETFGTCYKMSYVYYYTNYNQYLTGSVFTNKYKKMSGIICPTDTSATGLATASLSISTGYLPSKYGKTLPGNGAYSQNTGYLKYINTNTQSIVSDLLISGNVVLPAAGALLKKYVGQFIIPLQASLDGNTQVTITGNLGTTNIPYLQASPTDGTCGVFYQSIRQPISCTYLSSPTQLKYTLLIKEQGLLPAGGSFSIVHYGLTTNSSYTTVNVDIKVSSLLNNPTPADSDLIFKKTGVSFAWAGANYIGQSQIKIGSFSQWTSNKAVSSQFQFTFSLLSKGLYDTNRIRFDLGQFSVDNSASSLSPNCKVYNYDIVNNSPMLSHDWAAIDASQGLSKFQIWPQRHLINNNLTYVLRCYNFFSTSSPNPLPLTGIIVNTSSDLTGDSIVSNNIALPVLTDASTSGQITLTKIYTVPSTVMQMLFSIVSPGITLDSILYLNFPAYYANGLGPDIKCYTNGEIYCSVNNRKMIVRYLGEYAAGTTFTLTVAGVSRSINYNSGTFSYIVDNDDNPTVILTSGTFIDSVVSNARTVQNFPTFPIFKLTQSSNYLREQNVRINVDFYLPSTLGTIRVGQSLMMLFPPIYFDVLRFITPSCVLNIKGNTLKNYISSCFIKGMRLKMIFLDGIVTGSSYSLQIDGIINPTNPSSNVQKYSFQISDNTDTSIVAKTYSPNCNYKMPIFITNPIRKSLNYYNANNQLMTMLVAMKNIQSQQLYISTSNDYVNSKYERNAYLQPLNNLYTNPSNLVLSSGSNPYPIRFSSLSSGVNYVYYSKTGDGSFYSNLPPLILTTNKNYFTPVSFIQSSFKLPVNVMGTNYSVSISLPKSLYPMNEVNMTVTLSSTNVGVALKVQPTIIYFYPTKTTAYVNLYINDQTQWIQGATTNLIIKPNGDTYEGSAQILLNAIATTNSTPIISVTPGVINKKSASFSITCSQQGRIVYHVSRLFNYNISACNMSISNIKKWSQQSSIDGLRVSQTYYDCQDQIKVVNVITKNTAQTIFIDKLQASFTYTIQAFCQTPTNIQSDLKVINFSTVSNNGVVSQMTFNFQSKLTTSQKIKLVCALALYFNLNYQRVSTWDGYYCSELLSRRLLLQDIKMPRLLPASQYETVVYFGVNNDLLIDDTRALVLTQSSLLALKSELSINVTGLPLLYSYSVNTVSYVGSNEINTNIKYRIDTGPGYIFVEGMQLDHDGIIYYMFGDTTWTRDPTVSQIKKGSGPDGLPPVYVRILAYKKTVPSSSYMAWTDLPFGTYNMYIMATDSNPFDTMNVGTIKKYTITKQVPMWQNNLFIIKIGIFIVLLLGFI